MLTHSVQNNTPEIDQQTRAVLRRTKSTTVRLQMQTTTDSTKRHTIKQASK